MKKRNRLYFKRNRYDRQQYNRDVEMYESEGYTVRLSPVERLIQKKGGKRYAAMLRQQAMDDYCSSTCPNDWFAPAFDAAPVYKPILFRKK